MIFQFVFTSNLPFSSFAHSVRSKVQSRMLCECKKRKEKTNIVCDTGQHSTVVAVCVRTTNRRERQKQNENKIKLHRLKFFIMRSALKLNIFSILIFHTVLYFLRSSAMFIQWLVPSGKIKKWMCDSAIAFHSVVLVYFHRRVTSEKTNNRKPILLITRFIQGFISPIYRNINAICVWCWNN